MSYNDFLYLDDNQILNYIPIFSTFHRLYLIVSSNNTKILCVNDLSLILKKISTGPLNVKCKHTKS